MAFLMIVTLSFGVFANLSIPYMYKRFFDFLVSGGEKVFLADKLFGIILTILALNFFSWIMWRAAGFMNNYFQPSIMKNIYEECFEYLHKHSYNYFNSNFTGALVKRVNRFVRAFEGVQDKIYWNFLPLFLRVVVIFAVLMWMHPVVGLIMLAWSVLFMAFNYWFSLFKLKYDILSSEADSKVSASLADTITNNVTIKMFAGLSFELKDFKKVTCDWFGKTKKSWDLGNIAEAVQTMLMMFLEFAIMWYAVGLWREGVISVGDFVWIQSYLLDLFIHLWDFGRTIRDLYEHLANAEEMTEVLNMPHAVKDPTRPKKLKVTRGEIVFDKVNFSYNKGRKVVKDLSFRIKPGEKVALIGPSGGGKTTVTRLLLRLFDVEGGKVLVDGQDISKVLQDDLRSQISLVPQEPILFHRSLMDNIRYGRRNAKDAEVVKAAKLANCHDFIEKFPEKYETFVGERGVKLSGGERQRVAIARAILSNAKILILDEATSSLDSEAEAKIQEALENLMKNKTTLVIAHRLSTIMRMDRIIVFKDGGILEEGTHADLVNKKGGLYRRLWEIQSGGYLE